MKIYGTQLSPYTKKVLIALELKQLNYTLVDTMPGTEGEYRKIHPSGKIPALITDELTLCDSTVICEYLDEMYPQTAVLYPGNPVEKAKVRWLEEYVDSELNRPLAPLFYEKVVNPKFFNKPTDEERAAKLSDQVYQCLGYLEAIVAKTSLEEINMGYLGLFSLLLNAEYSGITLSGGQLPALSNLMERLKTHEVLVEMMRRDREILLAFGFDVAISR